MEVKEVTDKNIWEKFIFTYSPQSFFQSWNWGETLKKVNRQSHTLWRKALYQDNQIIGIAQIHHQVARRGTFLHVRHGPIFSDWNYKNISHFISYIKNQAEKVGASFIRISPLLENSSKNQQLFSRQKLISAPIQRLDGEYCWVLDLEKKEADLLLQMRKTTRYLIRFAQKNNVTIKKSRQINDLDLFLTLYDITAKRQGFVKHQGIKEEFRQFVTDDQALLFLGFYQGKLLSAAIIIFYNHQAIYHHSASIEQKIPVNYLLQWQAILEAKNRGKKIYNFWGIAPEGKSSHPWYNLTTFKKGFGGRTLDYLHARDLPLNLFGYAKTYLIESVRKISKGY